MLKPPVHLEVKKKELFEKAKKFNESKQRDIKGVFLLIVVLDVLPEYRLRFSV